MTSTSAIVNRALRVNVTPILREAGFDQVDARNGWRWHDKVVCVVSVRAVGSYFSSVTGWPPGSVGVWVGAFYSFIPTHRPIKNDAGRPRPAEHECHIRTHLECGLDQPRSTAPLSNPLERARRDIWWVEPDGSNAPSVATDIGTALLEQGLPWLSRQSNLATALDELEATHDCFNKFDTAAFLSREIGDRERWRKYAALAAAEGNKIGHSIDPEARYGM